MNLTPTPEQQRIIDLDEGSHLVVAPPGSGKTAVLTWRTLRLLRKEPAASWRILALTFTTKAAQTLRARIEAEVRAEAIDLRERLHASTIHAFCLDVLQHYGELVGFPVPVSVYDGKDRLAALQRAITDEALPNRDETELQSLLHRISRTKRALLGPDSTWSQEDAAALVGYDRTLLQQGACDYDDLLRAAWRLFTEQPRVARHYRRMYRYVLVDEAQDTSRAQYTVIRALCGDEHRNVMLVADDRQAIYGFSGASTEYLERFVDEFEALRHTLRGNFRCAKAIVEVANRLAAVMPGARPAPMVAAGSAAGRVRHVPCADERQEAEVVAAWIAALVKDGLPPEQLETGETTGVRPEDIAVLGRSRRNLRHVRQLLEQHGWTVLYHEGGRSAFEHPLLELVVRGLRLVQNPRDGVTRSALAEGWSVSGDLWDGLRAAGGVVDRIASWFARASPDADPALMLDDIVGALDQEAGVRPEDGEELAAEAEGLREILERWKGRTAGNPRNLGSFLADLAMAGRANLDRPGVRVLTIHAAKGLEFRAVAVVGWDDGSLPDFRATTDVQRREERRSAYVAVTRAARDLLVTWPAVRQTRFGPRVQSPSPFLNEMGL